MLNLTRAFTDVCRPVAVENAYDGFLESSKSGEFTFVFTLAQNFESVETPDSLCEVASYLYVHIHMYMYWVK